MPHCSVKPRSGAGRTIKAYIDSSDSEAEINSEDEVELLGGSYGRLAESKGKSKELVSSISLSSSELISRNSITGISSAGLASSSGIPWREMESSRALAYRGKVAAVKPLEDLLKDQPSEYDTWLKSTEEEAMVNPRSLVTSLTQADTS
jgi:hypothetical protein